MSDDHPRQALAAEQAILSAALNDPRNAAEALYLLSAADFYHPKHALIFSAIAELVEARISPDPITVMARLSAAGELERAGCRPPAQRAARRRESSHDALDMPGAEQFYPWMFPDQSQPRSSNS